MFHRAFLVFALACGGTTTSSDQPNEPGPRLSSERPPLSLQAWADANLRDVLGADTAELAELASDEGIWFDFTVNDPHGLRAACSRADIDAIYRRLQAPVGLVSDGSSLRCEGSRCLFCDGPSWDDCRNGTYVEFASTNPPRIRAVARSFLASELVRGTSPSSLDELPRIAHDVESPCIYAQALDRTTPARLVYSNNLSVGDVCGTKAAEMASQIKLRLGDAVCREGRCQYDDGEDGVVADFRRDGSDLRLVGVIRGPLECDGCGMPSAAAHYAEILERPSTCEGDCSNLCRWAPNDPVMPNCPPEGPCVSPADATYTCQVGRALPFECDPSCCGARPR
ncbi:MAG: hypothetical protein AAGE52_25980 [Myxococcota bacterium]